jgi:hypothetical protein
MMKTETETAAAASAAFLLAAGLLSVLPWDDAARAVHRARALNARSAQMPGDPRIAARTDKLLAAAGRFITTAAEAAERANRVG